MSGLQPVKRPARESLRSSPASWRLFVCTSLVVSTLRPPSPWPLCHPFGTDCRAHLLLTMCLWTLVFRLETELRPFWTTRMLQPWPLRNLCFTDCRASERLLAKFGFASW